MLSLRQETVLNQYDVFNLLMAAKLWSIVHIIKIFIVKII